MTETMRRVEAAADLLARECPLRELLSAIRETEEGMAVDPKSCNMDGDTISGWLWKVDCAITDLAKQAFLDRSPVMIAMFNCNYDPKTAAREWLRKKLGCVP